MVAFKEPKLRPLVTETYLNRRSHAGCDNPERLVHVVRGCSPRLLVPFLANYPPYSSLLP
jgi:hypothetical protein